MAATRLKLYNGALLACKVRSIASLTVNEESRRVLDQVWNDGAVKDCLEMGQWTFARRASKFTADTGITPSFGYRYGFAKPLDYCNTAAVCTDEYYQCPLTRYADEAGFWYADIDTLYNKYTSDSDAYGMNLALWPVSFTNYVEMYLASKVVGKLSGDNAREEAILKPRTGLLAMALDIAKNRDMQGEPARFPPIGTWSRARVGSPYGDWRDGGSRNRLIG